jgi:hypothetical protein
VQQCRRWTLGGWFGADIFIKLREFRFWESRDEDVQ